MGLPTSEELQKQEILKKFMSEVNNKILLQHLYIFDSYHIVFRILNGCSSFVLFTQHPEMDFSNAKFN